MNIKRRIKRLEDRNGFSSHSQRQEYLKYARLVDPDIEADSIRSPEDYLNLLNNHLDPLPHEEL